MSALDEAIGEALVVLTKAERQFTFYAEHHRAKGADGKAATNYGYALICGRAMERLALISRQAGRDIATPPPLC